MSKDLELSESIKKHIRKKKPFLETKPFFFKANKHDLFQNKEIAYRQNGRL